MISGFTPLARAAPSVHTNEPHLLILGQGGKLRYQQWNASVKAWLSSIHFVIFPRYQHHLYLQPQRSCKSIFFVGSLHVSDYATQGIKIVLFILCYSDTSATYFLFELLFVTRSLIEEFATVRSAIDRGCSLNSIGSRRQRHLFSFRIIICHAFSYRFYKRICHRAIHDRQSVFTPYYWFAMTAPPIFFSCYHLLRVFLTDFVKVFANEQPAIERVYSLHVIGSQQQRHLQGYYFSTTCAFQK